MYLSYNFTDKDPIIDELRTLLQDEQVSYAFVARKSGVSEPTLRNWFEGRTRRPQHASVEAVVRCLGYHRPIRKQGVDHKRERAVAVEALTEPNQKSAPHKRWAPKKRRA